MAPGAAASVMATLGRGDEADRTLFVGNLDSRVQEEILYELFLQVPGMLSGRVARRAGPVTKVTICKDKDGKPKTFGFACFKHTESVPYAIALLNGIRLYGRPIKVQYRFGSSQCPELSSHCQNMENNFDIQSPTYRSKMRATVLFLQNSSFTIIFSTACIYSTHELFKTQVNQFEVIHILCKGLHSLYVHVYFYRNLELYGSSPLPVSPLQVNSSPPQGYSAFQNVVSL
ncbi:hypothetical protein lerEdw1_011905 [Lerista edwardsae]|nr:hypothetical protein lerEdw1_011905 [Lerista edwardsae]